jgi:hypothetical protein
MPFWEVDLYVDGPVTVNERIKTTQQKGFLVNDPFYSNIEIDRIPSGIKSTVTAQAPNQATAYKAALFFFGGMIDALTLSINCPMYLSFTERSHTAAQRHSVNQFIETRSHTAAQRHGVRQIIEKRQFEHAFRDAHQLERNNPAFLRSLGWYRKGLTTDDPLDKFLAFWNAIEIVASKYYSSIPSINYEWAREGSKNQVRACFDALWGDCEAWPVIPGQSRWIKESYAVRIGVAHGAASIDVHKVAEVAERIPIIEEVSYNFLSGWRNKFLDPDHRQPSIPQSTDAQEPPPE